MTQPEYPRAFEALLIHCQGQFWGQSTFETLLTGVTSTKDALDKARWVRWKFPHKEVTFRQSSGVHTTILRGGKRRERVPIGVLKPYLIVL